MAISIASNAIREVDVYLLDTDVISEIRKGEKANPGVRAFFANASREPINLYLGVATPNITHYTPTGVRHP